MKRITNLLVIVLLASCGRSDQQTTSTSADRENVRKSETAEMHGQPPLLSSGVDSLAMYRNVFKSLLTQATESLQPCEQIYTLSPDSACTIVAASGAEFAFAPNSFIYASNGKQVSGPIRLKVKEYTSNSSFLASKLVTQTHQVGQLLETDGMFYLEATANGQKLELANGVSYDMAKKTADFKEDMGLFYGEKNQVDQVVWTPDSSSFSAGLLPSDAPNKKDKKSRLPMFNGSNWGIMQYFTDHIQVSNREVKDIRLSLVVLNFTVGKDGKLKNVRMQDCGNDALNNQFLYWAKAMHWYPGLKRGRPIDVNMTLSMEVYPKLTALRTGNNTQYLMGHTRFMIGKSKYEANNEGTYRFKPSRLGWLNCDRFITQTAPKRNYQLAASASSFMDVSLIFHQYNAVMMGGYRNKKLVLEQVPDSEAVTIVAVKYENGHLWFCRKKCSTGKEMFNDLHFDAVTKEELTAAYKHLDKI